MIKSFMINNIEIVAEPCESGGVRFIGGGYFWGSISPHHKMYGDKCAAIPVWRLRLCADWQIENNRIVYNKSDWADLSFAIDKGIEKIRRAAAERPHLTPTDPDKRPPLLLENGDD